MAFNENLCSELKASFNNVMQNSIGNTYFNESDVNNLFHEHKAVALQAVSLHLIFHYFF